eukprot:197361_1
MDIDMKESEENLPTNLNGMNPNTSAMDAVPTKPVLDSNNQKATAETEITLEKPQIAEIDKVVANGPKPDAMPVSEDSQMNTVNEEAKLNTATETSEVNTASEPSPMDVAGSVDSPMDTPTPEPLVASDQSIPMQDEEELKQQTDSPAAMPVGPPPECTGSSESLPLGLLHLSTATSDVAAANAVNVSAMPPATSLVLATTIKSEPVSEGVHLATAISMQSQSTVQVSAQKSKDNGPSDAKCMIYLARRHGALERNSVNNLRMTMAIGWKRAKRILDRFMQCPERYMHLAGHASDYPEALAMATLREEFGGSEGGEPAEGGETDGERRPPSDEDFTPGESVMASVAAASEVEGRQTRQTPVLATMATEATPAILPKIEEASTAQIEGRIMLSDGVVIDCSPADSLRTKVLEAADAEVRFRQPRKVLLLPGCRPDMWSVSQRTELLGMIEMKAGQDDHLETLTCYRSRQLVKAPRKELDGVKFAQNLYKWWKEAVKAVSEVSQKKPQRLLPPPKSSPKKPIPAVVMPTPPIGSLVTPLDHATSGRAILPPIAATSAEPPGPGSASTDGVPARFKLSHTSSQLASINTTDDEIYEYLKWRADRGLKLSISNLRSALRVGWKRAKEAMEKFKEVYGDKDRLKRLMAPAPPMKDLACFANRIRPEPKEICEQPLPKRARMADDSSRSSSPIEDVPPLDPKEESISEESSASGAPPTEIVGAVTDSSWLPYRCGTSEHIDVDVVTTAVASQYGIDVPDLAAYRAPEVDLPEDAKVVLILGASGSGKTTLLRRFGDVDVPVRWHPRRAVVSLAHFKDTNTAMTACQCIGFNTVPDWFKPYRVLSQGEKYRARLAAIHTQHVELKTPMLLDEFTSNVDRPVAKSTAASINKWIRRSNSRAIFAASNTDIVPYLQPDVIISLAKGQPPQVLFNPNPMEKRLRPRVVLRLDPANLKKETYPSTHRKRKEHPDSMDENEGATAKRTKTAKTPAEFPSYSAVHAKFDPMPELTGNEKEFFNTFHTGLDPTLPAEFSALNVTDTPFRSDEEIMSHFATRRMQGLNYSAGEAKESMGVGWKRAKRLVDAFNLSPAEYMHMASQEDDNEETSESRTAKKALVEKERQEKAHEAELERLGGLRVQRRVECARLPGVELRCEVEVDAATHEASAQFDYRFEGNARFTLPGFPRAEISEYTLGVMTGPSGSGKTQLIFHHFQGRKQPEPIMWEANKSTASHFRSAADASERLSAVCLDPACWVLPFDVLSQGEQERANIARNLGEDGQIIDEFTSLVDRPTAFRMASSISKYLYQHHVKGAILIACHADLIGEGLLHPTWMFDTQRATLMFFEKPSYAPAESGDVAMESNAAAMESNAVAMESNAVAAESKDVVMDVVKTDETAALGYMNFSWEMPRLLLTLHKCHRALWELFRPHHYMDGRIVPSSRTFLAQLHTPDKEFGEVVGFVASIIHFGAASKSGLPRMREHRTVVLPQYQGLGIGTRISDGVAHLHFLEGYEYYSKTAHPRFGQYRNFSPLWVPTGANGQLQTESTDYKDKRVQRGKDSSKNPKRPWVAKVYACHKYCGPQTEQGQKHLDSRIVVPVNV